MPSNAAERQKKYREKLKLLDPEKFKQQKRKNCERTLRQYRQKAANYSEEQKEELRQKWREDRKIKESQQSTSQQTAENVNPSVADHQINRNMQRRIEHRFLRENIKLQKSINSMMKAFQSLQRKVQRQQKEMEKMNKHYETIMMILKDKKLDETFAPDTNQKTTELTPMKRVTKFLNETIPNVETPKKEEIKKKLMEYDVLKESFKSEYKKSSTIDKNTYKRIVNSDVIKKYKQGTKMKYSLGLKISSYKARREDQKKKHDLQKKVISFYNRDDVSRTTAGKKEYRTYKKVKCQKRYLLDSLKRLHKKYVAEQGKLSFSTFKKYRPFYVLPPKIKDCETCACIKHSNMQFIVNELKSFGLLQTNNLNDIVCDMVCDFKSKNCMYGNCAECSEKKLDAGDEDPETEVNWFVWALKEYEYGKQENVKRSKKMMKIKKEGTLKELLEIYNNDIKTFKKHVFNFYFQYDQYKTCIKNLKNEEVMIHIDFSENYTCKHNEEVQAKHFVKDQITLHTGVIYVRNEKAIPFCSLSPDNQHNPESIWAHLDPVLNFVKNAYPHINIIHFFSDGPTTQYRQKKNFYLFSQKIYDYGFNYGTWSFFEAAHGKGAADGVGGAIKRTLDTKIAQGQDISDAQAAYDALLSTDTTIKIFYVPAENIKPLEESVVKHLTPLPGTMKIHQLTTCGKYKLKYRDLSCFCKDASGNCECHSPVCHDFATSLSNQNQRSTKRQNSSEINEKKKKTGIKKAKRHRKDSSSSTEEDTNLHVVYAESDVSDLSDISMSSELNLHSDENMYDDYLDEKTGIIRSCVDPNKKINILSTVIIQKAFQNSMDVSKALLQTNLMENRKKTNIQYNKMSGKDKASDKADILDGKKVTALSEIRHSAENIAYCDLRKSKIFSKINVSEKENIGKVQKEDIETIGECKMKNEELSSSTKEEEEKTKTEKTEILYECEMKKDEKLSALAEKDEKENSKTLSDNRIMKAEKLSSLTDLSDCTKTNQIILTKTKKNETEKTETLDDSDSGTEKDDLKKLENVQDTSDFKIDDSVIVRYYQRKQWKYYIGFVTHSLNKDSETFYKVRFLKTVKIPNLKFLSIKKLDIDVVPRNSIVKRVNLELRKAKEYFLENDFDNVYFE